MVLPRQIHGCFQFGNQIRKLLLVLILLVIDTAEAQSRTNSTRPNPTTDPTEAIALNNMFYRWGISATTRWNISGEVCSGVAVDDTAINEINPGIKCDCSYSANTTCHITNLRVYQRNVAGPLPQELWNLSYLIDLNLGNNYLTGAIPASIRNLNSMQYLSFGVNALSGEIPPELGQLTGLRSLSFGINNFSGPLPPEMGNLTRLTQLYIDSSGVSGEIPSSFARLRNLETAYACDNEFTGRIPDFIGNWSNLNNLRLQGNSFRGSIPSSFLGLASLNELRISDLVNGSSSLDFLRNMNSLSILNLRNNNISGEIPSFLSEFRSLTYLDLSFNSLSGTIPDFLLNLHSLVHLFLGNNMLTGALPTQKSQQLLTIDVSYNGLSGSFPFWIREQNLSINLVANNLVVNRSISRVLPSGLDCLQRSFPCGRGSPIYSRFAIKCGGPEIMTRDRVVYDMENGTLGPATYQMTSTGRWAVSNVGLPSFNNNPRYRSFSERRFANTSDYELFQTARVSTGSLRYYGLRLENGNYTVRLQFAETQFVGIDIWESLGRRVFDIYIQGILHARDFNIQREAGGTVLRAVVREYTALVTDNYLEIHFFWAGKGTYTIPYDGTYGPLISAISATPDFNPTVRNVPPNVNRSNNGLIVGIAVPVGAVTLIFLASLCYVHHKRKRQKELEDHELLGIDISARPVTYTYADLKVATENFSPSNKLGEGGFGPVYKGTLGDGRKIAVKQLSVASDHGKSQFIAEIATISAVQHRNLVKLYGCCIEGVRRLLVYEFLENKSLDQLLFGIGSSRLYLDWPTRYDILLGVARGLAYLHEESQPRIVHRDVKASNILLDSDFTPKLSDFGLAKLFDDNHTHISTKIAGTRGYLAPEYAMHGHLTEKADIFSFGVVVLEIVSGRPNADLSFDDDKIYLLERAWNLHGNKRQMELVDPNLQEFDEAIVEKVITVGLLCTQASPSSRPSMSRVVAMITGDIEVLSITLKPNYLTEWNINDVEMFRSTEIFSSSSNADSTQMSSGYLR